MKRIQVKGILNLDGTEYLEELDLDEFRNLHITNLESLYIAPVCQFDGCNIPCGLSHGLILKTTPVKNYIIFGDGYWVDEPLYQTTKELHLFVPKDFMNRQFRYDDFEVFWVMTADYGREGVPYPMDVFILIHRTLLDRIRIVEFVPERAIFPFQGVDPCDMRDLVRV